MQIYTQNWLNKAQDYLHSFSTHCSNGESIDRLCLRPAQYHNLARMVNAFGSTHRRLQSELKDAWDGRTTWQSRCLICEPDSLKRGATFSTRVRYLGPLDQGAPDDYAQLAFYKETFECKVPIDLSPIQNEETKFGSPEMTPSWKDAGWNAPTFEWTAEHCKVPRFTNVTQANDSGVQFECLDDVCLDRNTLETSADCTLIAAEKLNFDSPFTRPEIPSGMIPLVSGGEMKEPWAVIAGSVSTLAFALLTCQAIRKYRSDCASTSTLSTKPSFGPAWVYAAATTALAALTLFAYQNQIRIYTATFL